MNRKILCVQSNWGGEYQKLNNIFKQIGVTHHVSCPHTHQQNGPTKRKHQHIVDVGPTLLTQASMPLRFWGEVFLTAYFFINRIPSRVINQETPLQRLLGTTPDYHFLHTFRCPC